MQGDAGVAGGDGHRRREGADERLSGLLPAGVAEAGRPPQLGQHDEVVAPLGAHEVGDPLDARLHRLGVVVCELDDGDPHQRGSFIASRARARKSL